MRTRGAALARVVGCEAAIRAAETASWRSTSAIVRPAFTRPTTVSQPVSSDGRVGHCGARARGIHACTPFESSWPGSRVCIPWKRGGATPMTVNDVPPSSTGRPMASSRPSRWVRQKYSVTTATGAAAGRSSSGLRSRPRRGVVRRTLKKSPETKAPLIETGPWLPAAVIRRSPSAPIASSAESAGSSRMIAKSLNDSGAVTIRRPPPPDSLPVGLS